MDRLSAERELRELYRAGDRGALRELVEPALEGLWPIARALARESGKWSAEDLYQEGALALVKYAERWEPRPGIPFAAAARQRARGAMKDFLRRRANAVRGTREQPLSLDSAGTDESGRTLGDTLAGEAGGEAAEALDLSALGPLEREVVAARILRPRPEPMKDLAARLGKPADRLRAVQTRAMRRLLAQRAG